MKFAQICQLALATLAAAAPASVSFKPTERDLALFERTALQARAANLTDVQILNFALTLEHLEKAFYKHALEKFTEADFKKAGYVPRLRTNVGEIFQDEKTHVSFLKSNLQSAAVPKCSYKFGDMDVNTFMQVAGILEGVGVTAYLGAAHLISNGNYLTAAGSILTVEARHSSYIRDNMVNPQAPFPFPFDVPQTPMQVFSLASQFITSCPKAADLGFTAFPTLTAAAGSNMPVREGKELTFDIGGSAIKDKTVKAFYIGHGGYIPAPTTLKKSGKSVKITTPPGVAGQSYVILSSQLDPQMVSDANTLAGPAIVMIQPKYAYGGLPTKK